VSAQLDLFQYDLMASDIQGSIQLVGQLNPVNPPSGVGSLAFSKLAPNGKIYIASPGSHKYLSVINRPNCPGTLCDFQPWAIELLQYNYAGLPNLPHFDIPESDSVCDSISQFSIHESLRFNIYPNPATDKLFIQSVEFYHQQRYTIYDLCGAMKKEGIIEQQFSEIDISELVSGSYLIHILDKNGNRFFTQQIIVK
jgi:hypothetical protein